LLRPPTVTLCFSQPISTDSERPGRPTLQPATSREMAQHPMHPAFLLFVVIARRAFDTAEIERRASALLRCHADVGAS
jgi:hypothetical protein